MSQQKLKQPRISFPRKAPTKGQQLIEYNQLELELEALKKPLDTMTPIHKKEKIALLSGKKSFLENDPKAALEAFDTILKTISFDSPIKQAVFLQKGIAHLALAKMYCNMMELNWFNTHKIDHEYRTMMINEGKLAVEALQSHYAIVFPTKHIHTLLPHGKTISTHSHLAEAIHYSRLFGALAAEQMQIYFNTLRVTAFSSNQKDIELSSQAFFGQMRGWHDELSFKQATTLLGERYKGTTPHYTAQIYQIVAASYAHTPEMQRGGRCAIIRDETTKRAIPVNDLAIEALQIALEYSPNNPEILTQMGLLYVAMKKPLEALERLTKVPEDLNHVTDCFYGAALYQMGVIYSTSTNDCFNVEKARQCFAKTIAYEESTGYGDHHILASVELEKLPAPLPPEIKSPMETTQLLSQYAFSQQGTRSIQDEIDILLININNAETEESSVECLKMWTKHVVNETHKASYKAAISTVRSKNTTSLTKVKEAAAIQVTRIKEEAAEKAVEYLKEMTTLEEQYRAALEIQMQKVQSLESALYMDNGNETTLEAQTEEDAVLAALLRIENLEEDDLEGIDPVPTPITLTGEDDSLITLKDCA